MINHHFEKFFGQSVLLIQISKSGPFSRFQNAILTRFIGIFHKFPVFFFPHFQEMLNRDYCTVFPKISARISVLKKRKNKTEPIILYSTVRPLNSSYCVIYSDYSVVVFPFSHGFFFFSFRTHRNVHCGSLQCQKGSKYPQNASAPRHTKTVISINSKDYECK